jgi:hypothetical protein
MDSSDLITSAATHGGTLIGGAGVSAWVLKLIFGDMGKRLDRIEESLEKLIEKNDQRHENLLKELGKVEMKADAAFRRFEELKERVERMENRGRRK